jgi:hypothetical protein
MQALLSKAGWKQHWRETLRTFLTGPVGVRERCQQIPGEAHRFSSSAQGELQRAEAPTIKCQLRLLYKRVHPDLFHSHPTERVGVFARVQLVVTMS